MSALERRTPLKRTGGLKRTGLLKRTDSLRRTDLRRNLPPAVPPRPSLSEEERRAAALWWAVVTHDKKGKVKACIMCGGCLVCAERHGEQQPSCTHIEGHHTVQKQKLKRIARERHIDPALLVWDPANGVPLCVTCHGRHTLAFERVPGDRLPATTWEWAESVEVTHLLEIEHP